jgi:archaetidylinositol phosphate synthase
MVSIISWINFNPLNYSFKVTLVLSVFKKEFEELLKIIVTPLVGLGVNPNHITIVGLIIAILSAWLYANWDGNREYLMYGAMLILFSGFLDTLDGVLARTTGKVTRFGGFLDSVIDRYSDVLMLSGLIIGELCQLEVGLVALTGSLMVSYTRSRAEMEGVEMSGVGFFERAERIVFLAICSLAAYRWLDALNYGVIILALFTHLTLIQRIIYFKKEVERN